MERYYQKTEKDCLSAVVGTLLQIDPDTIPLFVDLDSWRVDYGAWLLSKGFCLVHYKLGSAVPYIGKKEYFAIGTLKHEGKKHSHAVILKCTNLDDNETQFGIYHDPLGCESPYDSNDLTHIELLVKFDDILNGEI